MRDKDVGKRMAQGRGCCLEGQAAQPPPLKSRAEPFGTVSSHIHQIGKKPAGPMDAITAGFAILLAPGSLHAFPHILHPVSHGEVTRPEAEQLQCPG